MYQFYSIYDRVAGVYSEPFLAKRKELAVRKFRYLLQNTPMVASDCDLFCLGEFDTETGLIKAFDKPEFVDRLPNE